MSPTRRYYSDDDPDVGVTPSKFKKLGRVRQLSYMRHWFETFYEDPAHETPRDEGEFLYVWGGPYDAHEELGDEFGGLVSDHRIEEAVELVEADGTIDWAPTSRHPVYQAGLVREATDEEVPEETIDDVRRRLDGGLPMSFGNPGDLAQRAVVQRHLEALRTELVRLPKPTPGKGHNNPPPDGDGAPSINEVEAAIADIGIELNQPTPDVIKVAWATSRISSAAKWLQARCEKAAEKVVEDAIRVAWGTAAIEVAARTDLSGLMHRVVDAVLNWIHVVGDLF